MISGIRAVATAGGVLLRGQQSYESRGTVDKLDGQTGSDNGFSSNEPGSFTRDLVLEFVQDSLTGMFIELSEGSLLSEVKVYNDHTANIPIIHMPFAFVFECQVTGRTKERLTMRVTIENYKQYTLNNPGSG
jgi:hypothetical protein